MSTPPFIDIPRGVALLGPSTSPAAPAPVLLAEARRSSTAVATGGAVVPRGTVLLVPGFTGSKEDFIAVLPPLAAKGWRTAAMDLPGQNGHAPLGGRASHSEETLAGAVLEVVRWLGAPVHLVGHSLGGLVTRHLVLDHCELLASWTVLCSGPAAVGGSQRVLLEQLKTVLGSIPMQQIWAMKEALDQSGEGWSAPTPEIQDFLTRRFLGNDPAALADLATILITAVDRSRDLRGAISTAGIGGAVISGELDPTWPLADQKALAAAIGLPWHVMAGGGHSPAATEPTTTAELLDSIFASAASPNGAASSAVD